MSKSFLNIITLDGREIRVAEFGFLADSPSFDGDSIVFRHGEKYKRIDLISGVISKSEPPTRCAGTSPNGKYSVRLNFTSPLTDGRGYCEMVLRNTLSGNEQVLVRFMGCDGSIGAMPFSADGQKIVFFGYPEDGNM